MSPDFAVFFRNTALQSFGVSAYAFKPAPCLAKKSLQNQILFGFAILRCSLSAYRHTPSSLRLVLQKNPCKIISYSVSQYCVTVFRRICIRLQVCALSCEKILAKSYLIQFSNTALQSFGVSAYALSLRKIALQGRAGACSRRKVFEFVKFAPTAGGS